MPAKRSEGVIPEVNVRNPSYTNDVSHTSGSTRSPKQRYEWPQEKTDVLLFFLNKNLSDN